MTNCNKVFKLVIILLKILLIFLNKVKNLIEKCKNREIIKRFLAGFFKKVIARKAIYVHFLMKIISLYMIKNQVKK